MARSSEKKTLIQIHSMRRLILVCLLSQVSLMVPVLSRSLEGGAGGFAERKDYYSPPDPHGHGHGGTPHGSHGSGAGSPPCTNPPSTGGGSGGGLPPTIPSPGGGSGGLPPTTPSPGGGTGGLPPTTPSPGGGTGGLPPTTPSPGGGTGRLPPTIPSPGGGSDGHGYNNPPTSPVVTNPPVTVQPAPLMPTPPMFPDPNSPFSCDYWRTHPTAILGLLGYWCPLSQIFGLPNPTVIGGSNASLLDALSNPGRDGISALYREGTAAYLNSLATRGFYFTSQQVRDALDAAAASGDDRATAAQAEVFRRANEGRLRHH